MQKISSRWVWPSPDQAGPNEADRLNRCHHKTPEKEEKSSPPSDWRRLEGPGPSSLVCTQSPDHIHWVRSHCVQSAPMAIRWDCPIGGFFSGGGGWVLPATLGQITHRLVFEKRREVRPSITPLPGDPSGPRNSHTPSPFIPWGAAGAFLALQLQVWKGHFGVT